MTKKIKSIGILKESRPDESRAPIAPSQVSLIIKKYPDINIIVQPCDIVPLKIMSIQNLVQKYLKI